MHSTADQRTVTDDRLINPAQLWPSIRPDEPRGSSCRSPALKCLARVKTSPYEYLQQVETMSDISQIGHDIANGVIRTAHEPLSNVASESITTNEQEVTDRARKQSRILGQMFSASLKIDNSARRSNRISIWRIARFTSRTCQALVETSTEDSLAF